MKISDVAFDLDDTLLDTSGILIPEAIRLTYLAMNQKGLEISENDFSEFCKSKIQQLSHREIFHELSELYSPKYFSKSQKIALAEVAIQVFYQPHIPPSLPLMPGAIEVLQRLSQNKIHLHLITSGIETAQKEKIKALNIESFFDSIYTVGFGSKSFAFESILQKREIKADNLLGVGNRISHEIREAKKLGAWTCYFAHGEHFGETQEGPFDKPDYTISNWKEFFQKCPILNENKSNIVSS